MRKFAEVSGQELTWEQPRALKMEFELRAGEELVGTLRFRSSFGSFATAETADGCWTFKRVGFWQPKVTVRVCDTENDIATYKNETWSSAGLLALADGRTFSAATNFWQTKFDFSNESGETLIEIKSGGMIHLSATVTIGPGAANLPELPWIVILGWYIVIMMRQDAAALSTTIMPH